MSIPLKLETLCGGGVIEALHHEVQNVLDNVADPNTEAEKVREVRLVLKVKPNKHRNMAAVTIQASSKLIAAAPLTADIMIDKDGNRIVAAELYDGESPGQGTLPGVEEHAHNVSKFPKKEAANA